MQKFLRLLKIFGLLSLALFSFFAIHGSKTFYLTPIELFEEARAEEKHYDAIVVPGIPWNGEMEILSRIKAEEKSLRFQIRTW